MIPEPPSRRKSLRPSYVGRYADVVHVYIERGWPSVFPLPPGQKSPPPRGFTGAGAQIPTPEQIDKWCRERPDANVGLALVECEHWDFDLLGVDVDNYAKADRPAGRAIEVLTEVERRGGVLYPPTPSLSHRHDGSDIRIYRVPKGMRWRSKLGPGVELIHKGHRYIAAGMNPETGKHKRWRDVNGELLNEPPRPQDFAWLPGELVHEHVSEYKVEVPGVATIQEANRLLRNLPDGAMSAGVHGLLDRARRDLGGLNGSRHDLTLGHVRDLLKYGAAGVTGTATALSVLKDEFVDAVWRDRDHRGAREIAADEFDRMVTDGARRVAAMPEGDLTSWSKALAAMEPGGFWHPDRLWLDDETDAVSEDERVTRFLSDVEPAKVQWLWRPWLPLGKVSILEGDPDVGKSMLTLTVAATVSTGRAWPETRIEKDTVRQAEVGPAGVVLVGLEDDEEDTIVPRLIAASADLSRVATMRQPVDGNGDPAPFVIPDDVERLRRAILEVGARLVVIDPVTAFLSTKKVKVNDDPTTRQALMPLVALAHDTGCAILLVRHLNKATGMSAKHRGSGTIAYTGITRSVLVAGKLKEAMPNGPTHAIALTKGNLTKAPMALGYRLESAPEDADTPIVQWLGTMDLNADQIVGADGAKVSDARKSAPTREECERVLRELLADGPMRADEATQKTREVVNCSAKPVRDAAAHMGIVKQSVRIDNRIDHWTWEMPPTKIRLRPDDDEDAADA